MFRRYAAIRLCGWSSSLCASEGLDGAHLRRHTQEAATADQFVELPYIKQG